jgi:glycerol-3-phosphate O-acyltransferase
VSTHDEPEAAPLASTLAALPDSGDRPLVVLIDAPSVPERRLVDRWLDGIRSQSGQGERRPLIEAVPAEGEVLAARLTRGDNPLLVPVRVTWGERELRGRLLRLADAATRGSRLRTRARVARPGGARHRFIVGRPATVTELRRRHQAERTSTESADFVAYVARQATLALDRAERGVYGNRFKVPRQVSDQIVGSGHFVRAVEHLAGELDRPTADIAAEAESDLAELAASLDPSAIETFAALLRPMHAKAWEVHADTSGLAPLRALNAQHALVFLPAHRSYTDPFVLADVLHDNDFPRNHVLGGNNLRILGLEALARRSGVIFIRRSFGKDAVYKAMVREYFQWLTAKRFNLEWYMEGGRSRTGKLRPPKYGLLADVASAVESHRASDVYLVPVSITHDQLQEVHQMAAEQTGTAKTPEGLRWLASYARAQRRPVGGVHVAFGTPVSLRAALTAAGDPALESGVEEDPEDSPARRLALQKTAFEVFVGVNRVTPVTPIALATLTLLGVRDRALTLSQVRRVVEPVLDYVDARRLPHTGVESLRTNGGVAEALLSLRKEKVVSAYTEGTEPVFSVESGHHIVAAFYRNSAIHHFVNRAIIELAILEVGDATGRAAMARGFEAALALRDLLKFEFFFPDRETFRTELVSELTLIDPDWRQHDDDVPRTRKLLTQHRFLCAHRVLRSFVDAQWVVAGRLVALGDRATGEKDLLERSAAVGRQMLLQGTLHGPESLSHELFSSAIALARNRALLGSETSDDGDADPTLGDRRRAFAAEVRSVVERIVTIDEIDATNRQETTGVRA